MPTLRQLNKLQVLVKMFRIQNTFAGADSQSPGTAGTLHRFDLPT